MSSSPSVITARIRRLLLLVVLPVVTELIRTVRRFLGHSRDFSAPSLSDPSAAPSQAEWEVVPDTDEVWNKIGWSHDSVVETQRRKWKAFLNSVEGARPLGQSHEDLEDASSNLATHNTIMTFGYVLGRVAALRRTISVLDWGGGLGHYYIYARALFPEVSFDFTIKDLTPLCRAGAALIPEVTYLDDDHLALSRRYDLVVASSSIHYSRDPYKIIGDLCDSVGEWLLVTRTPIVEHSQDFVVVQRPHAYGYLTEYPGWFMNRTRLVNSVTRKGLSLERQFLVGEQPSLPNAPEIARYYGFLFRRAPGSCCAGPIQVDQ